MDAVGMKALIVATDLRLSVSLSQNGWIAVPLYRSATQHEVTRRYKSDTYQRLMTLKERIVLHILARNRNSLSLDTDVILFQDFFPAFEFEISENDVVG